MRNLEFLSDLSVVRRRGCIRRVFVCDAPANGFCEIIRQVLKAWAPVNFELALFHPILDPIKAHVDCLGSFLFDCFVHDVVCSGVIRSQRRWGLCVAQLGECDSERGATLGVVKARSNF